MRIVGGVLRRTPLPVLAGHDGLRPTPERVRETLFNWIGDGIVGAHCLDPFAGTGALALEAASRGAERVLACERDSAVRAALDAVIARLRKSTDTGTASAAAAVMLRAGDGLVLLDGCRQRGERFHWVFLDPPFGQGWLDQALARAAGVLDPDGAIYVEADAPLDAGLLDRAGLAVIRQGRAGDVHYHLCVPTDPGGADRAPVAESR